MQFKMNILLFNKIKAFYIKYSAKFSIFLDLFSDLYLLNHLLYIANMIATVWKLFFIFKNGPICKKIDSLVFDYEYRVILSIYSNGSTRWQHCNRHDYINYSMHYIFNIIRMCCHLADPA